MNVFIPRLLEPFLVYHLLQHALNTLVIMKHYIVKGSSRKKDEWIVPIICPYDKLKIATKVIS